MSSTTNTTAMTREAASWPKHKAKARARKADRAHIARTAQQAIDREAEKKL
ncbi:hypothetical protein ACMX2H_16105 [Arthrobacter sulfonylureivorans]|uniref:hypothetical protein n=1 Tax=Arthrobacter sulfonylureivorans TaxID=2486855 RepID=UPI0039E27724